MRKSALRRNYLIQNRWANWAMSCIDFVLSLWTQFEKKGGPIRSPKKILLTNLAHRGDVLLMSSLLSLLKASFPDVQIGVLIASASEPIVKGHPLIDFVHIFDHWKVARNEFGLYQNMKRTWKRAKGVVHELKRIQYDISLECNFHFPNTIFLTYRAKIPVRIGYISGGFGPLLTHSLPWTEGEGSAAEYTAKLLSVFLSIKLTKLKPFLPIPPLPSLSFPKEYLVIHMGSGNPIKEWPLTKWKSLTKMLLQKGHYLVFTGKGAREEKAVKQVIESLHGVLNLCNVLSWQDCVAVLKNAKALISVDTCMGHLSAATDTPAVLIYHGIHPIDLWKPLSSHIEIVTYSTPCHPCHLSRGCSKMTCIQKINENAVLQALEKVLSL